MRDPRPSPIALAVLSLLYEEPMHPYRMQKLIRERKKDEVINVRQRASLYQVIRRLLRDGLIRVRGVDGEGNLPERTVYELTESGRETAIRWMREMLARPVNEYPLFPAALAHLPLLSPDDAAKQLKKRLQALRRERRRLKSQFEDERALLPRLFLLESEYLISLMEAEIAWLERLIGELESGKIAWNQEALLALAKAFSSETERKPSGADSADPAFP